MNIFYLNHNPQICAEQHVDKHVVKMILESAQLLSTAHRLLDGIETTKLSTTQRIVKHWQLPDEREICLYSATHKNHPSAIWTRHSAENYHWLYQLFLCLINEYQYRYEKTHACTKLISALKMSPTNIAQRPFTEPTPAMPENFKIVGNSVKSYQNYYNGSKSHLFSWKKRSVPDWINANITQ